MNFETSNLVLETLLSVLLQKFLKVRSVLASSDPSFLQRQRLGESYGSFNYHWFKVSVKLHLAAVKALLDTTERDEGGGRDQVEQMKGF